MAAEPSGPRCPSCKAPLPPRGNQSGPPTSIWRHFPFCSERCQAVDLGHWFAGDFCIPGDPVDPQELPPSDWASQPPS